MHFFSKKNILILIIFINYNFSYSQQKISNSTLKIYAKEVYADYKEYQSPEALKDYKTYLERVSVINENSIEFRNFVKENIKPLSSVRLKNKYANITYDNYTNFNVSKFNALKYAFNYESKQDQVFLVNGTKNYILIKAKK